MPVEEGRSASKEFASLQSCFVEGSAEQRARERRSRRRALIISVAAQAAVLTTVVLVPLFAKPERLPVGDWIPLPPYYHSNQPKQRTTETHQSNRHNRVLPSNPYQPPTQVPSRIDNGPVDPVPEPPGIPTGEGPSTPCVGCLAINDGRNQPLPPPERPAAPKRLLVTHLEPAMLVQRVEPVYPILMQQIRKSGHVELRAVIATDGTIQSLQVVSGDAGFVQSALDAVRQWRYRPTVLNGQPVEIDTFITVTYNLQQ